MARARSSASGFALTLTLLTAGAPSAHALVEEPSSTAVATSTTESINAKLKGAGCRADVSPGSPAAAVARQIRTCANTPGLGATQRAELLDLESRFLTQQALVSQQMSNAAARKLFSAFQEQIDALKRDVAELKKSRQESERTNQAREQELNQTIANLRQQVATLEQKTPATVAMAPAQPGVAGGSGGSATAAPTGQEPAKPPKFRPTLTISGSANLVVGGVTGPSTSLATNYWTGRVQNTNRDFANSAVELSPNSVTGATNKAGGTAYAYYLTGQSNLFFPPNGLQPVSPSVASNYAIASSWTGGKVRFTSLSRGGNLIITDPSDPNYNATSLRTLDKGGYDLSINLKGQPVVPNSGLGGLINPTVNYEPVNANSFNLSNLGSDITFANIPLGSQDLQNLINLANESRSLKIGNNANQTQVRNAAAGDTISTLANRNGTSAARLLELNPQLPPSTAANTVLAQGTPINVPTVGCVVLCQGLNTVANGGLVQNTAFYDDLLNLAIAEYGSLSSQQQNNPTILAAAQTFVRGLVSTTRDDAPEIEDFNFQRSYTFNNDVKVHFRTSFTGSDLLNVSLRYRNIVPYGERGRFPSLNLAYGFGTINDSYVSFDRLWWKIPFGQDASLWVGTRYKDYDFLPVQYGTFYPVEQQNYFFASGAGLADYVGSGAGFTYNNIVRNFLGGNLSIGGGYMANPIDALNPVSNSYQQRGIVGRDTRFRAPFQLGYVSNDGNVLASLNYVYSKGDTLNAFVGTNLSANPFFYDVDSYNQVGATFAWEFLENISLNLVYNHFYYTARENVNVFGVPMAKAGDTAKAQSWMAALVIDDLIVDNAKMGLAVGQVPSVYSNTSAWGTNTAPIAFEAWYNYPFSDRVYIQPAVFLVTNHDGFSNGGTDWGSTFRVYLNF
jgi:LysM repeat protein